MIFYSFKVRHSLERKSQSEPVIKALILPATAHRDIMVTAVEFGELFLLSIFLNLPSATRGNSRF